MSAVDWVLSSQDDVHVGDVVSADAGGMPIYTVVAIDPEGEALLEDEFHAAVRAPLDRFPWKAAGRA
jgi:hypothetical protein